MLKFFCLSILLTYLITFLHFFFLSCCQPLNSCLWPLSQVLSREVVIRSSLFEQKRMRGDNIEEERVCVKREREREREREEEKMAKVANKGRDQLSVSVLPDYLFSFFSPSFFLLYFFLSLPSLRPSSFCRYVRMRKSEKNAFAYQEKQCLICVSQRDKNREKK